MIPRGTTNQFRAREADCCSLVLSVRWLLVELSWRWLRLQPDSELTHWFERRFASGGKRMRRIGIVALARRLVVALWRYVQHGQIPAGATLKTMPA